MTTPIEKAKELIEKFCDYTEFRNDGGYDNEISKDCAKKCALISVELVIIEMTEIDQTFDSANSIEYWKEVEEEIKKL